MDRFGHNQSWLSVIFNDTIIHIYQRFKKMLKWDEERLIFAKLSEYAMAIHALGGGCCFWGFIDRTLNAIYRLVVDQ